MVCKNAPKIKAADRFRAKGLIRCVKSHHTVKNSSDRLRKIYDLVSSQSEEKVVEYISKTPPKMAESLAIEIESNCSDTPAFVNLDTIRKKYPEFASAPLAENDVILQMKAADASNHPILNDVNTDFLRIARKYRDSQKGFKEEIIKILNNRESSANKTLEILYSTLSKVWELTPLIELTMTEEQIEKQDHAGKLIRDRVKDVEKGNTIRNIGMLAMGIGLGVVGFFTGGSAWAGLAWAAGGAALSGVDLIYELDAYKLHSNAAKATLGSEFSDDPGVLGVTLAILSLVFDIGSPGKAAKVALNSSAKAIAASDDVTRAAQEAGKLFDELEATGKIDTDIEIYYKALEQGIETDAQVIANSKFVDSSGKIKWPEQSGYIINSKTGKAKKRDFFSQESKNC